MSKRLFKYDDFVKELKANEAAAVAADETVNAEAEADATNEGTLQNIAMSAAAMAGMAGSPSTASGATMQDPHHQTTVTQSADRKLPPGTASVYVSGSQIDAALGKLEHRKMFKMKYTGDKKAIIGIGDYDYPIYRSGSPELAEYQSALNGARTSSEKFFWANGLVYANPNFVSKEEAAKDEIQVASMATSQYAEPAAATPAPVADVNATQTGHVAKMSDISSFVVKAQGLWDLRAKGGEIKARVNGREVTYTNQDEFVKDYVLINYKIFVQDKFGEKTNDTQITKLMDDAISRVGR